MKHYSPGDFIEMRGLDDDGFPAIHALLIWYTEIKDGIVYYTATDGTQFTDDEIITREPGDLPRAIRVTL